jgi:hypothetical protein
MDACCRLIRDRCMKDGELAESGSHDALIQKGGEYCRLYQVQARGFAASDVRFASLRIGGIV